MSEYQYYEFQAVDRPLTRDEQHWLRSLSSRATITATSFVNTYNWGDFKGQPRELMQRCFDLHFYNSNYGVRRLMIRVPKQALTDEMAEPFLGWTDGVRLHDAGDDVVLDIVGEELRHDDYVEDETGQLSTLGALRTDLLNGDPRLLYLVWLQGVQGLSGDDADDVPEPLPGIGPLTPALEAFVNLFQIDANLVAAAAERDGAPAQAPEQTDRIIAGLSEQQKNSLLRRVADGDPRVAAELRLIIRDRAPKAPSAPRRTIGELRARAAAIAGERAAAEARRAEHVRQEVEALAQRGRDIRLTALARRGEYVWRDIETAIAKRSSTGYAEAVTLIGDLREVARRRGTEDEFARRFTGIQLRHAAKGKFIERLREMVPAE